jgi:hypothetical protein
MPLRGKRKGGLVLKKQKLRTGIRARAPAMKFLIVAIVAILAVGASIAQAGTKTDNSGLNMQQAIVSSDHQATASGEEMTLNHGGLVIMSVEAKTNDSIQIEKVAVSSTESSEIATYVGEATTTLTSHEMGTLTANYEAEKNVKKTLAAKNGGTVSPVEIVSSVTFQANTGHKKTPTLVGKMAISTPSLTSFDLAARFGT